MNANKVLLHSCFAADHCAPPCVSVIVLTYNHEKYIAGALDSILMQKGDFSIEILVGDDASQDGTVEILKRYQKKYPKKIRLFLNSKNLGATRNAYQLLVNAKGNYLAACEGDDYWTDPEKLHRQIRFLEEHPEMVGCTHYCTIVDENNKKWAHQQLSWIHYKDKFTLKDFNGLFMPGQPSTFLRRNLIGKMSDLPCFYTLHRQIGDRTLMLLYLMQGDFGLIRRSMSCYRRTKKSRVSVTQTGYADKLTGWQMDYKLIKKYESICRIHGREEPFREGRSALLAKAIAWCVLKKDQKYWLFAKEMLKDVTDKRIYVLMIFRYWLKYAWLMFKTKIQKEII